MLMEHETNMPERTLKQLTPRNFLKYYELYQGMA